jgi:predicted dehydrogenase
MPSHPSLTRREFIASTGAAVLATALPSTLRAQPGPPLTLALVGAAHIHTPGYVKTLKAAPGVVVKCVWDHDGSRAAKSATLLGARVAGTPDEIWSDPEIAGVVILSETNRHHDLVLAAARARKHMFVEKPLGITASESLEMANAIEDARLIFTTGYFMRTDPKHIFLRQEVAKGNFGVITRVRGSNCHNGSLGRWFDTEWRWMADPKIAGIGGFGDLGTHKLDILMWLFGAPDSVAAAVKPVTGHYGDCDETGEALIKFRNGTLGTLGAGWVDIEDPVKLQISGTEAHAVIIDDRLYYNCARLGSDGKEPYVNLPAEPKAPMLQFLAALGGSADQPLVTAREAAARVAAMEAMYRASREAAWVKVG